MKSTTRNVEQRFVFSELTVGEILLYVQLYQIKNLYTTHHLVKNPLGQNLAQNQQDELLLEMKPIT
ncbi:MAG: hypothetical protein UU89_C0006G0002 [Parcubacteria group bacterium GW2011_GWC2_42_11]|nr:MAG: hypothetical protein UU89_C0006G0002 [Parcubacteria group bacterium GW2011_GWC2_42_11]